MNRIKKLLSVIGVVFILLINTNCIIVHATNNKENEIRDEFLDLKEQWYDKKFQLDKQMEDVNQNWILVKKIFLILGIPGLISIIVEFIYYKKTFKKRVNQAVNERIADMIMKKSELLEDLIEKQTMEDNIIKNKRLLAISVDSYNKQNIDSILLKKFCYKENILLDEFNDTLRKDKLEDYDLILFNKFTYEDGKSKTNIDKEYKNFIKNIIKTNKNKKVVYFWFNSARLDLDEKQNLGKYYLNFSNSDIMLYSNVLESLKFQNKFLK